MPGFRRRRAATPDVSVALGRLNGPVTLPHLARLERRRTELEQSTDQVGDAFEATGHAHLASVGERVRSDSSPVSKVGLLFRLVELFAPTRVVEFGSAFGVSGAYIVAGMQSAGGGGFGQGEAGAGRCRSVIAAETIGIVDAPDVTVRTLVGLFDEHLDVLDGVGFFFLDGNHFAEPTRHYTEAAFARGDEDLVVVLDDIAGYSGEMEDVWSTLRSDARVH